MKKRKAAQADSSSSPKSNPIFNLKYQCKVLLNVSQKI